MTVRGIGKYPVPGAPGAGDRRPNPSSRRFRQSAPYSSAAKVHRSPSLRFVPVDAHHVGQMVQITEEVRRRS